MTDILRHISRLINDVFESGPPLNGTLIGMQDLLFNQGEEFIAPQNLCRCWWKCMIGLCKCYPDVICSRQQPIWLSIRALCFPVDFFIDCAAIVHHWLVSLRSAVLRARRADQSIPANVFTAVRRFPQRCVNCARNERH